MKNFKLNTESQNWFNQIKKDYAIVDSGGLAYLRIAAESLQRMREAQDILASEGIVIEGRYSTTAHPAIGIEKDSRNALILALSKLNLTYHETS